MFRPIIMVEMERLKRFSKSNRAEVVLGTCFLLEYIKKNMLIKG